MRGVGDGGRHDCLRYFYRSISNAALRFCQNVCVNVRVIVQTPGIPLVITILPKVPRLPRYVVIVILGNGNGRGTIVEVPFPSRLCSQIK